MYFSNSTTFHKLKQKFRSLNLRQIRTNLNWGVKWNIYFFYKVKNWSSSNKMKKREILTIKDFDHRTVGTGSARGVAIVLRILAVIPLKGLGSCTYYVLPYWIFRSSYRPALRTTDDYCWLMMGSYMKVTFLTCK